MDNDNSRMSTDLFYDDEDVAEMVEAANKSLYDPKKPYAPVLCTTSGTSQKLGTTLSGLSLGSDDCAETTKLFLKTLQTDLVVAEAEDEQQTTMDMDMDQQQEEGETLMTTDNEKTMSQAPSSFISASYFFHEAKERLKHGPTADEPDDKKMIDERNDENKSPESS